MEKKKSITSKHPKGCSLRDTFYKLIYCNRFFFKPHKGTNIVIFIG